jgi:RNA polymerase sigma-70 factor, ECF subfamily
MISQDHDRARAEAELCARYQRRVYLYGVRHMRDVNAAEDFVQDVLATVIERVRAGALNDPAKLGSFVLGTCRMHAVGRKRSASRRARILALYADPRTPEGTSSAAVETADLPRVRECLARLADRDRTVLLLTFYAELDAAALGHELGVEASHARVIRLRALARLQTCVKGAEETAP